MKVIKPHNTAAREALEEAGILGKVAKSPLGGYSYAKRLENGWYRSARCRSSPSKSNRNAIRGSRKWFAVADAAEAADEPELREAMLKFEMFAMGSLKRQSRKKRYLGNRD